MLQYLKRPLYKYCSGKEEVKDGILHCWDVENFNNDFLYFSDPTKYNDPYDSHISIHPVELFKTILISATTDLSKEDILNYNELFDIIKVLDSGNESQNERIISLIDKAYKNYGDKIFQLLIDPETTIFMQSVLKSPVYRKYISKSIIGTLNEIEMSEIAEDFIKSDEFRNHTGINMIDGELYRILISSAIEGMKLYSNKFKIPPDKKILFSPIFLQYCHWFRIAITNNPDLLIEDTYRIILNLVEQSNDILRANVSKTIATSCMSELNDSVLMWSHYANKHEGFCLEYDFSSLDINDPEDQNIISWISPIKYSEKRPYITHTILSEVLQKKELSSEILTSIMNTLLTKNVEWNYEKEWRIFKPLENSIDKKYPYVSKLFLGMNIGDKLKNNVIKVAEKKKIPVYQMYMDTETYKMKSYQVSYH